MGPHRDSLRQHPVSRQLYIQPATPDVDAQSIYNISRDNYNNGSLTEECLAISKMAICADTFPRCIGGATTYICTFLCDTYKNRCPSLFPICKQTTSSTDTCCYSSNLTVAFSVFLALLTILLAVVL